ncbi:MAG TPA: DUF91 domain-containing protein [Bacilli bacterium]|nr:DUF91 domain-containing protein [Bacilli bacterium]
MTHVFVVDQTTFKYHLEYLFAGTGAQGKTSPFLVNASAPYVKNVFSNSSERMLVGMIADISRIRVNDKVIFYLQSYNNNPGRFYGVFKASSIPFFDENDSNNYLVNQTQKGLSFRILIEPDEVYAKGVTEHDYLDSLKGKKHPSDLCWSLIYRKLKGNRGCTMIMDYEYDDLIYKIRNINGNQRLNGPYFSFDATNNIIINSSVNHVYQGRRNSIDILPRLLYKSGKKNAFETHLQAYLTKNIDNPNICNLFIPYPNLDCWIGNEVSCGVGMQRIDLMLKQETDDEVVIRLIELKDESPYIQILDQISWYLEWLSDYVIPKYTRKKIRVIPTIVANGIMPQPVLNAYQNFNYTISGVNVEPLQYIGFNIVSGGINFTKYL